MSPASLPPAFAPADQPARTLHVVRSDGLETFLHALPDLQRIWLKSTGFSAALGDLRLLPDFANGTVSSAVVGYGSQSARARTRFGLAKCLGALPHGAWALKGNLTPAEADEAALGFLLASYRFDRYRSAPAPHLAQICAPDPARADVLTAMAQAEFLTRDLINTPAADMGPAQLQAAVMALADRFGGVARAVVGGDLLAQNFPMIHAVGRAADPARAPRLLELNWGNTGPHITLVGKGVCFDTGGLDIKPASGMLLMKKDMGGAAAVLGLAQMIMQMALPLRLRVLIPAVENAISGNAMRPRDILRARSGQSVEVNNTDAEGRLVLADALALATETPTDAIISMATLTGAARVAVGPDLAPYFCDDPAMAAALEAGAIAGLDPVWRLPFHTPYEAAIEPSIADLDNAPEGGFAGAITAALFLRRFANHPRYMHFDIYGHSPADLPARPKGGAGQGARAIFCALPQMLGL
ncbi:MAG: leucyl aminopeptidase family protein [Cypionkella sp.]